MRRGFGVGLAAEALAVAAIFAGAERQSFRIGVGLAHVGGRRLERMIAKLLGGLLHDRRGHGLGERLVGIFVLARAFEDVAAFDFLAAQVAGLAGDAGEALEPVVVGLKLVVGDREVLDRHVRRDRVLAVAVFQVRAQIVIARQQPPGDAVPVRARAAHAGARQERAETADWQRCFGRRMAQRHRLHLRVLKQLLTDGVFQVVADRRQREILVRRAVRTALEANNFQPGLGELARENAARKANPDRDRIHFLEHGGHECPLLLLRALSARLSE